jgi:(4-(4-[2-(gamma-L-glutamylamino)ethyl]phenoxymethyl)furan-2-yl)methanamine synthase
MTILGIDIGGANLKFCDTDGNAHSIPFPMWKQSSELASRLRHEVDQSFRTANQFAISMTGEMADCFADRRAGVRFIVDACRRAFGKAACCFYSVKGGWHLLEEVATRELEFAASNWRALAQYASSLIDVPTLLVDIGSTTTDIIKLSPGAIHTSSISDFDRLLSGELVYTGVERSNIAALLATIKFNSSTIPIVNELFATSIDAYLVLGLVQPDENNVDTADGKSRSIANAKQRLARTIGLDAEDCDDDLVMHIAHEVVESQVKMIAAAITNHRSLAGAEIKQVLLSGHGDFLVKRAIHSLNWQLRYLSLSEFISPKVSRAACAYAVAKLLQSES